MSVLGTRPTILSSSNANISSTNSYQIHPMFNVSDLNKGEGEWKNMQDIIRKAFRYVIDHNETQQTQLNLLNNSIISLKSQLAGKYSKEEVEELLVNKNKYILPREDKLLKEIDELKLQIIDLKSELERKASFRYVDDSLRRKLDRSDSVIQSLVSISGPQHTKELAYIMNELGQLKGKDDFIMKTLNEINEQLKLCGSNNDIKLIQSQMNELYSEIAACPHRNEIDSMLNSKFSNHSNYLSNINGDNSKLLKLERDVDEHSKQIMNLLKNNDIDYEDNGINESFPRIHGSKYSAIVKRLNDIERKTVENKELRRTVDKLQEELNNKIDSNELDECISLIQQHNDHFETIVKGNIDVSAFGKQIEGIMTFLNIPQSNFSNIDAYIDNKLVSYNTRNMKDRNNLKEDSPSVFTIRRSRSPTKKIITGSSKSRSPSSKKSPSKNGRKSLSPMSRKKALSLSKKSLSPVKKSQSPSPMKVKKSKSPIKRSVSPRSSEKVLRFESNLYGQDKPKLSPSEKQKLKYALSKESTTLIHSNDSDTKLALLVREKKRLMDKLHM